jgi:hypothetical protein
MPGRLTLRSLPVLRGERVILRERRESDIDDRLRYPIDPGEEDNYGSSWRRDWDGRRYHTRDHLAADHGPAEPGNCRWAVEHEGHRIGSAGLRGDADQHCATYTVGLFMPGLRHRRRRPLGADVLALAVRKGTGMKYLLLTTATR